MVFRFSRAERKKHSVHCVGVQVTCNAYESYTFAGVCVSFLAEEKEEKDEQTTLNKQMNIISHFIEKQRLTTHATPFSFATGVRK